MKTCEDCLLEKSEKDDFYQHPRTGAAPICKSCTGIANKLRRQDPEAYKALVIQRRERRRLLLIPDHKVCTKCSKDKLLGAFREKSRGLYGRSSWCLDCEGLYTKAYTTGPKRNEHLERRRQQWATQERTVEERRIASQRSRDWYGKNKKRALSAALLWRLRHPEGFKAIQKKYLTKNPVHIRRRVHMNLIKRTLTPEQWAATLEWFNHSCAYCLRSDLPMTQDHVIPVSKGGDHTQENVVPACKSCNSRKLNRPVWVMSNVKETSHGTTC